jgi:hypothetical protein
LASKLQRGLKLPFLRQTPRFPFGKREIRANPSVLNEAWLSQMPLRLRDFDRARPTNVSMRAMSLLSIGVSDSRPWPTGSTLGPASRGNAFRVVPSHSLPRLGPFCGKATIVRRQLQRNGRSSVKIDCPFRNSAPDGPTYRPRRRLFQDLRESLLALQERQPGGRRAVRFEKVECEIDARARAPVGRLLHQLEGRYAVGGDAAQLSVE